MTRSAVMLLSIALFFSGCSQKRPQPTQPTVTIEQKCPKLRFFYKINTNIPKVKINVLKRNSDGTIVVRSDELVLASNTSQKVRSVMKKQDHQIDLYIRQIKRYNELYVKGK